MPSCVVADPDGRVIAVGDAWLAAAGKRRDEVVGRPLDEVVTDPAAGMVVTGSDGHSRFIVVDDDRRRLISALMQLPAAFAITHGPEHVYEVVNDRFGEDLGRHDVVGKRARELGGELLPAAYFDVRDRVYREGIALEVTELPVTRRWPDGVARTRYFTAYLQPLRRAGAVDGILSLAIDVTETVSARAHTEAVSAAHRQAEERFRLAIAAAELGAWHSDLPGGELQWDDTLRAQFGLPPGARPTAERFFDLVHPDDRERVRRAVDQAVATGELCDVEYRTVAPADGPTPGRVRWLRGIGRPFYDADGTPVRFDGVTFDITDRKLALDALGQARDQLAIIVEAIGEGVLAHDAAGVCVFCNEVAGRMAGFSGAAALVGAPRDRVIDRWDIRDEAGAPIARAELPVSRALRGEACERVMRVRSRRDGEERWIRFRSTPVRGAGGPVELVVSVLGDFTERKRAEEAHQFIAEAARVLGSSLDYASTLRTVAQLAVPHLADWCAVEMKTADGSQQLAVAHVDPKKVELAWTLRERYPASPDDPHGVPVVLRTGRPELIAELTDEQLVARTRDPEQLRIARELGLRSALLVPITGARGTIGVITMVTAESGRRYTEADLRVAMELAGRAALAVDNALLYVDAQRAVRLRDDFLSIAGHELRTPLTALQLQLQGLSRAVRRDPAPGPAQVIARLDKATGHVARLERLIDELLDVSRITTGRLQLHPEAVDLVMLAADVLDRFTDEAQRRGVRMTLIAPASLPGVWDRMRLDQVLTNLVSNALKYGSGRPVDVELHDGGETVRLVVRDRGIGISGGDQARVFGRFERAVSERHYGGLGLGLWIVRQIVEALGGAIALASEPDVETTFRVELPRGDRSSQPGRA